MPSPCLNGPAMSILPDGGEFDEEIRTDKVQSHPPPRPPRDFVTRGDAAPSGYAFTAPVSTFKQGDFDIIVVSDGFLTLPSVS